MKLVLIGLLALFGHVLVQKISYKNYKVYKIIPKNEEALKALRDLEEQSSESSPYQYWIGPTQVDHEVNLMVAPDFKKTIDDKLDLLDISKKIVIEDLQKQIDIEKPRGRSVAKVNWKEYNTLSEINNWLEGLATTYPNVITIIKPGKTYEGRDIVGVKLDYTPTINKKAVFMESNIHAREWVTSATTTWILNEFLTSTKESIKWLAKSYTWYFFPVMNPDGFVYSHTVDRMWRKTRKPYGKKCYGADPNRNWSFKWGVIGASLKPCSDIYAGPQPFSEPSVKVMSEFIASIASNLVAYLDFHSYAQVLMVPYGHTAEHLDNYNAMERIGRIAVAKLKSVHGTNYRVGNVKEALNSYASGSSFDWVKATFRTPIVFAYELRDRGEHGFILPAEQIIPTAEEVLVSVISLFEEYKKPLPRANKCERLTFNEYIIIGFLVLVNTFYFDY